MSCIFCRIVAGELPSKKAYEDERVLAFYDIAPQAPVHVLVIPKEHIESAACIDEGNAELAGYVLAVAARVARQLGTADGYRLISNIGDAAGQSVKHLHFHLLAGADMSDRII